MVLSKNEKIVISIIVVIVFVVSICAAMYGFYKWANQDTKHKKREPFTNDANCVANLKVILEKASGLQSDNMLGADIKGCLADFGFTSIPNTGKLYLFGGSTLRTVLQLAFQERTGSDNTPYISKFIDFDVVTKPDKKVIKFNEQLDTLRNDNTRETTLKLLGDAILPFINNLNMILIELLEKLKDKPQIPETRANIDFIKAFLSTYYRGKDSLLTKTNIRNGNANLIENILYAKLVAPGTYGDPIVMKQLGMVIGDLGGIIFNVDNAISSATLCMFDTNTSPIDNDIKKYTIFKGLVDLWRAKNVGIVNFTEKDLKEGSYFTGNINTDLNRDSLIKFFKDDILPRETTEWATGTGKTPPDSDEAITVKIINKLVNDDFVTSGGPNDLRIIKDPDCGTADKTGHLYCDLLADASRCTKDMPDCITNAGFNKYCTSVKNILDAASNINVPMPIFSLDNLPTTPVTTSAPAPAPVASVASPVASAPVATSASAAAPVATSASVASAASAAATEPALVNRSSQEQMMFIQNKVAELYAGRVGDLTEEIKQAVLNLDQSGRSNICARYCGLTSPCSDLCKTANCANCRIGANPSAGSELNGLPGTSLGYAGVDEDYDLMGFLTGSATSDAGSGQLGTTTHTGSNDAVGYKHMGPIISQKDTQGVSNIFAPYIIMAPKKQGSAYGAYLLEDPNDPSYQEYIRNLVANY